MTMTTPEEKQQLEKAINWLQIRVEDTPFPQWTKLILDAAKRVPELEQQVETLQKQLEEKEKEHDEEVCEFQNKVKNLIDGMANSNVDGGGCESGDWCDFTLSEIGQGLAHVIDERDELKKQNAKLESRLKEVEEVAERQHQSIVWASTFLNKLFSFGEKGGAFLNGVEYAGIETRLIQINDSIDLAKSVGIGGGK